MSFPDFPSDIRIEFTNFKSDSSQFLCRADSVGSPPESVTRIVSICNEPLVYDFLFRRRLVGKPYDEAMAKEFLSWAVQGWTERTHYVFFATDAQGVIHGALDIKSNQRVDAEIGYWASSENAGAITNAVAALCRVGKDAGYKSFVGLTLPDNERSAGVLKRNAFSDLGLVEDRGRTYRKFHKIL
jgi:RimJ/RimL family protein N-acetyltransferase